MKETILGTLLFFVAILVLMFAGYGREIIDRIRGKDEVFAKALLVRVHDAESDLPVEGVLLALQPVGQDPGTPPDPSQVRETNADGEARWSALDRKTPNVGIRAVKEGYRIARLSAVELLKQAREHGEWLVLEIRLEPDAMPDEGGYGEDPPPR